MFFLDAPAEQHLAPWGSHSRTSLEKRLEWCWLNLAPACEAEGRDLEGGVRRLKGTGIVLRARPGPWGE